MIPAVFDFAAINAALKTQNGAPVSPFGATAPVTEAVVFSIQEALEAARHLPVGAKIRIVFPNGSVQAYTADE